MANIDLTNILNSKAKTAEERLEELQGLGFRARIRVHGEETFTFPREDWRIERKFEDGIEAVDSHKQTAILYCQDRNMSFQYFLD
ncbi:MAG: hypothetical protein KKA65_04190 [Nanoarchaeota archaeon]|nr:hypothetical protein [Nanoarchaeota archaeon]MBU4456677.1 hypothetical protein [Nanoarchaeota archaeon]MCG2719441.1 hypothetical protein [Nanoarchaeota archaeon]